jgi:hypothetical protein
MITKDLKEKTKSVFCAALAKMSSKNKNRRLYLVIFGYIYRNLVKLRLNLAPRFGLGASGAFFGVFLWGGQRKVAKT